MNTRLLMFLSVLILSSPASAQRVPTTLRELTGRGPSMAPLVQTSTVEGWTQGAPMIPSHRYYGGSVMYDRNDSLWLYVFGGDTTGGGHASRTCSRYSVEADSWELIAPLPTPMRVNAAARLGDKLYTLGGFDAPFPDPTVQSFYEYDVNTNVWTQLPDLPAPVFFTGAVGYHDSLIYIIGGIEDVVAESAGDHWRGQVDVFNTSSNLFTTATELLIATANFALSRVNNLLIIGGGLADATTLLDETQVGEINASNYNQIVWDVRASYPFQVNAHYAYAVSDNKVYLGGGSLSIGFSPTDAVFGYNIANDEFESELGLPNPVMAFYGGTSYKSPKNRGGEQVVTIVIAGGVTTGPALTGLTWIYRDTVVTGVTPDGDGLPRQISLNQNYPNPFNGISNFSFGITELSGVTLVVYDLLGRAVETIVDETLPPGTYRYQWEAKDLPSGVYFYRLTSAGNVRTRKLVLMK